MALFSALFVPLAALAATEQDFKTPEYYASNGLDLINAAPAYAQGFTGKGVLIGLLDTEMQSYHPELSEKFEVVQAFDKDGNRLPLPTVWDVSVSHGTHVASIMAAKKDDNGMHGVAFDSNVVGQVYIGLQEFIIRITKISFKNILRLKFSTTVGPHLSSIKISFQQVSCTA